MSLKLAPSDYEIYIPLGEWIEGNIKEWLFEQRPLFKKISAPIDTVLNSLDSLLNFIPFPIILLIFVIFAYRTNGIKFAIFSFLSLLSMVRKHDHACNDFYCCFILYVNWNSSWHHCFKKQYF